MRYSSSVSSDRSCDDNFSSSQLCLPTNFFDSSTLDNPKTREHCLWLHDATLQSRNCMFDFEDEWMHSASFGDFDLDCQDYSLPQEEQRSAAPTHLTQLYGEQFYPENGAAAYSQPRLQAQSSGPHGRFPSTSSIASCNESPFTRHSALSAQPYPSTQPHLSPFQPSQQSHWNYDLSSPAQHLPTPITTPTSDKHFQVPNPRRTKPTSKHEAALAAAHQSARATFNQQWRPSSSYLSPRPQNRSYLSQEMPRTPRTSHGGDVDVHTQPTASASVAKLDRTVSDAQADELYNPATFIQPPPMGPRVQPQNAAHLQAQTSMLQDRLRDANEARSSSPSQLSGHASPWRDSPYSDGVHYDPQNMIMPSAATMREKRKAKSDAYAMRQKKQDTEEPKTVSPKDAFPEQQVAKEDENLPSLFPTDSNQSNASNSVQYAPISYSGSQEYGSYSSTTMPQSGFTFTMPSAPASAHSYYPPQQNSVQYGPVNGDYSYPAYSTPARLVSMETTKSDNSDQVQQDSSPEPPIERPADTTANAGRYTCPYADMNGSCNARFDNPTELNKHKREVHRQAGPVSLDAKRATAMTQTGPHKCTRINPSTNKPCNTVFSRPYDLTRHQDTIHGEGRKLRCPHCAEEKLFSRNDALTRHLKVVHSQQLPAGKGRGRRAG